MEHIHTKILVSALERQVSWVTLMLKLLIISVTYHMPQNRVSDTIMHVALNIVNNVLYLIYLVWP